MSVPRALAQLRRAEARRGEGVLAPEGTLAVALARVGGEPMPMHFESVGEVKGENDEDEDIYQHIHAGTLSELSQLSSRRKSGKSSKQSVFGQPLHSLVIVGRRAHEVELEFVGGYYVGPLLRSGAEGKGEEERDTDEGGLEKWWDVVRMWERAGAAERTAAEE